MKLVKVVPSTSKSHKYTATFESKEGKKKVTHFGAKGYDDYTITGSKQQKEREEEVKASYDPIVMVEQSDSDPEDLEAPPGVIIVRRKRRKPTPEYSQTQIEADRAYARMFGL